MLKLFAWRRLVILAAALLFTYYYFPHGDDGRQEPPVTSVIDLNSSSVDGSPDGASTEVDAVSSSRLIYLEEALARTSEPVTSWSSQHISPVTLESPSPSSDLYSYTAPVVAMATATPAAQSSSTGETISFDYAFLSDSSPSAAQTSSLPTSSSVLLTHEAQVDQYYINETLHRIVYSVSTPDRQYFAIDWLANRTYNANILPHPTLQDQYVLVAQLQQNQVEWMTGTYAMHCTASFVDGMLVCNDTPQPLDIPWTPDTYCPGDPYPGPHDPRVFYGPNSAFAMYGSRSNYNCHGMWVHDLQHLIPEFNVSTIAESFPSRTDIQRPPPYREIEKNYFLFWDHDNNTYAHYDIHPDRIFAQVYPSGAVGPNLALMTTGLDIPCLDTYMPKLHPQDPGNSTSGIAYQTIHQTANSLSITLCNRTDPTCHPTPSNTFILSLFQHKIFDSDHAQYFPYILLHSQSPPFAIHAISTKSIWIHGRSRLTNQTPSPFWRTPDDVLPFHSELFFVVSMAWKSAGQRYHGYVDDEIMLGLGIEDYASAGIDVVAGDLLQDLGYCDSERVESFPSAASEGDGGG